MTQDERDVDSMVKKALAERREQIKKEMPVGSFSDVKDFPLEDQESGRSPQRAIDEPTWGRLGNMRVFNVVHTMPEMSRTYENTGVAQATLRRDPFLDHDASDENALQDSPHGGQVPPQGVYSRNLDVDGDKRSTLPNWRASDGGSGISGPASFNAPGPGRIGGVAKRAGFWKSFIFGGR